MLSGPSPGLGPGPESKPLTLSLHPITQEAIDQGVRQLFEKREILVEFCLSILIDDAEEAERIQIELRRLWGVWAACVANRRKLTPLEVKEVFRLSGEFEHQPSPQVMGEVIEKATQYIQSLQQEGPKDATQEGFARRIGLSGNG